MLDIKQELQEIVKKHDPSQAGSGTETLIQSILKLPVEDCTLCGYEHLTSQIVDGLCPDCLKQKQEDERLLKDQREHPEKLLSTWGVPKKHIGSSFENYKDGEALKDFLVQASKKNEDVLLCGATGCGKTHLAVATLRSKIERSIKPFKDYNPTRPALFITVPELLFEIRQTFRDDSFDTEKSLVDKYSSVPLLILDDLGAEKTTDWAESTLYLIIDRRNRDEKWTIVTSNLTLQEIEQSLGARIASRLSDMKVINIKLPDYRKKRAVGL
jgi:DNA replication protein DnaC